MEKDAATAPAPDLPRGRPSGSPGRCPSLNRPNEVHRGCPSHRGGPPAAFLPVVDRRTLRVQPRRPDLVRHRRGPPLRPLRVERRRGSTRRGHAGADARAGARRGRRSRPDRPPRHRSRRPARRGARRGSPRCGRVALGRLVGGGPGLRRSMGCHHRPLLPRPDQSDPAPGSEGVDRRGELRPDARHDGHLDDRATRCCSPGHDWGLRRGLRCRRGPGDLGAGGVRGRQGPGRPTVHGTASSAPRRLATSVAEADGAAGPGAGPRGDGPLLAPAALPGRRSRCAAGGRGADRRPAVRGAGRRRHGGRCPAG